MPASATATRRAAVVEMPLLFTGDVVTIDPTSNGFDVNMSALIKTGRTCMDDIHAADEAKRVARAAAAAARAEATPNPGAVVRLNRACGTYAAGTLMSVEKINPNTIGLNRLGGNQPGEYGMRIDPRGAARTVLARRPRLTLRADTH